MLSISWITPFLVLISALVTRERLMRTPAVKENNSRLNIAETSLCKLDYSHHIMVIDVSEPRPECPQNSPYSI